MGRRKNPQHLNIRTATDSQLGFYGEGKGIVTSHKQFIQSMLAAGRPLSEAWRELTRKNKLTMSYRLFLHQCLNLGIKKRGRKQSECLVVNMPTTSRRIRTVAAPSPALSKPPAKPRKIGPPLKTVGWAVMTKEEEIRGHLKGGKTVMWVFERFVSKGILQEKDKLAFRGCCDRAGLTARKVLADEMAALRAQLHQQPGKSNG